jgi:hypothetical protein
MKLWIGWLWLQLPILERKRESAEDGRLYTPHESWLFDCEVEGEEAHRLFVQVVAANAEERVTMVNDEDREEEDGRVDMRILVNKQLK